uniref:RING-type domain-containing protein n=1 Tax=Ananas comosus var. bracteatus TaxID=296719 RepID=A0A6V7NR72_ANACO|nr:unnamed protein product [Ananas comosus var. bracteatus]
MLLSSQVFSFRSVSMADVSFVPDQPESSERGAGNTRSGLTLANTRSAEVTNHNDKIQYGKVSATEVVQAVHDMLSAAGVNLDAEKQSLLQTTLSLQEKLKESQVSLLVEQEKAEAAVKEADGAKAAWLCRVCLTNEVNITIISCGHVLCNRCSASVSRCPFCRTQVSRIMKILGHKSHMNHSFFGVRFFNSMLKHLDLARYR